MFMVGPDISSKNSASEIAQPYRTIELRDVATSSRGTANGDKLVLQEQEHLNTHLVLMQTLIIN